MNKKPLLAMGLIFLSATAWADPLNYTYLNLGASHVTRDGTAGGEGYSLSAQKAVSDSFYAEARFDGANFGRDSLFDTRVPNGDIRQKDYSLRLGWHAPFNDGNDFVARAGYLHSEGETDLFSDSHGGYTLGVGVRGQFASRWEYLAFVDHDDAGVHYQTTGLSPCPAGVFCIYSTTLRADASENVLEAGVVSHMSPSFGVQMTANHSSVDSANRYLFAAHWSF